MLVRSDLTPAQQMVQSAHAAHECGIFLPPPQPDDDPDFIVLCSTDDEASLLAEHARLVAAGVRCRLIHEPDLGGCATALAAEAVRGAQRHLFRSWRLWAPPCPAGAMT